MTALAYFFLGMIGIRAIEKMVQPVVHSSLSNTIHDMRREREARAELGYSVCIDDEAIRRLKRSHAG